MTKTDPATKLRLACEAALNDYIEAGKTIVQETVSADRFSGKLFSLRKCYVSIIAARSR